MKKVLFSLALLSVVFTTNAQDYLQLSCPDENHPHAIDLGLTSGTKWACCNVGADKPIQRGNYYAWGETEEKSQYTIETYKFLYPDPNGRWAKDNEEGTFSYMDLGESICGTEYDVAHVKWGGSWVMPSYDQIKELIANCSYEFITINGVKGALFTGNNGISVFLPAASTFINDLDTRFHTGEYRSGTKHPTEPSNSLGLYFFWNGVKPTSHVRNSGHSVRPVMSLSSKINLPAISSSATKQPIYNIYGIKVAEKATDIKSLPPGIYIVNGKKMVVKNIPSL